MGALVRWSSNAPGIRGLLKLPGVRADLARRAEAVRAAAEPRFAGQEVPGDPVRVVAGVTDGPVRVGATVIAIHPVALGIEMDQRILGGAIDAAGG